VASKRKKTTTESREERLAEQARWDETTRRLQDRIERGLREMAQRKERRESS
jgi:hypothetical protein